VLIGRYTCLQIVSRICFVNCEVHLATITMHKGVTIEMSCFVFANWVNYLANGLNISIYQGRPLYEDKNDFVNWYWLHCNWTLQDVGVRFLSSLGRESFWS
jgi:hypothetical protein